MRTIIVGDIHGCFQSLIRLLKKLEFNQKEDRLISLGDLMDRGSESYEVLRFFCQKKQEMGERCVLIRGNHEQMLIDAVQDHNMKRLWHMNGGLETERSFLLHGSRLRPYALWLDTNTVLYWRGEGYQCVHGGIADEELEKNSADMLIWDRDALLENQYSGRLTIVGHTPMKEPAYFDGSGREGDTLSYHVCRKLPGTGMICIDTGCVFGGRLTAMVAEEDEYRLEKE